jgi:hypothetical protein
MIGNLTGQGSIRNRDLDFYREIHMALKLNPLLCSAAAIKNAAWIYYISGNDFSNIYPWASSGDFKFSKEFYSHEFYSLGLRVNNPARKRFWTGVYVDEYGKGLMTTCAAPVDDDERFVGTVAIDLTVDFLNTVIRRFDSKKGVMFLVNERDQLLTPPPHVTSDIRKTWTLSETLPMELHNSINQIRQIPENKIMHLDSYDIMVGRLYHAPWKIYYIKPANSFWSSLAQLIGPGSLIVLVSLMIFIGSVLALTQRHFIFPSNKFINYIMARSKRIPVEKNHKIHRIWKPWFETIESCFNEKDKFAQDLREQNENLEQRVRQRTAELEKEIKEREKIDEERERLIEELKKALVEVKELQGFIPICSNCKNIRDDTGYWQQVEEYIQDRSGAQFSHGICPECMKELYPNL